MSDDLRTPVGIEPRDALEEGCSELGNARRLVRLAGQDLRYVHPWTRWLVWDGARWAADLTGAVERRAKMVVESIPLEAAAEPDETRRTRLLKHALTSQGARAIRNMIALAQSERAVAVPPEAFDRDPSLLNVQNGTLELRTATLRPHRREDYITKLVPVAYDPAAACPTFLAFLNTIFRGRATLIDYVQHWAGYSLTGDTREQALLLCHGTGANGKTTLMQALTGVLADYAATLAAETLLARKGDAGLIMNDLATLQGARFAVVVESDMGRRLSEALVKTITGGEPLKVKRLYADVYAITPTFKLWLGTNHKPVIRGTDKGIWRRMKLVPFDVVIPEAEQDHQLLEKLERERPGILRWAVEGCVAWYRHGLGTPDEVRQATAAYRGEMDPLADFFADRCVLDPAAHVPAADLYSNYTDWAKHAGETPLSQKALAGHLVDRGCIAGKKKGERGWTGLRLRGLLDVDDPSTESVQGTDQDALSRNLLGEGVTQGSYRNARPDVSTGGDESTSDMFDPSESGPVTAGRLPW